MVTAETVVVLPFVVLVACVLVWVVSLGVAQMRVADASREAARLLARGQSTADARAAVREAVPGARMRVSRDGDRAGVTVRYRARLPLVPRVHLDLSSRSVAVVE